MAVFRALAQRREVWQEKSVAYRQDLLQENPYGERSSLVQLVRSVVDVPFSHGTLAVASPLPQAFSEEDLDFLKELSLSTGDALIFCSDGIAEAFNAQEEIFGFERTAETICQACAEDLPAKAVIERLINTVKGFAGDAPQGDDMTVVVLKVEA